MTDTPPPPLNFAEPPAPSFRIATKAQAGAFNLKCVEIAEDPEAPTGGTVTFQSDDGSVGLTVPRLFAPFFERGQYAVTTVALMLNLLEPIPEPLVDLKPKGLILPEGRH